MKKNLIIILLYIIQILRFILYPFTIIASFYSISVGKRVIFERMNLKDEKSKSFRLDSKIADYAFEVSSEGELEQIRPILIEFLETGKLVELLYASDSVERKCHLLAREFENLRILRMPLATMFFSVLKGQSINKWLTAKSLILCRYDLYPELLLYGFKKSVKFTLVSATLKGKSPSGIAKLLNVYSYFDEIILASDMDRERFVSFGLNVPVNSFDFRVLQVLKRVFNAPALLKSNSFLEKYSNFIKTYNDNKVIFGSFWPSEAVAFSDENFVTEIKAGRKLVVLAPHHLDEDTKGNICMEIRKFSDVDIYDLNKSMSLDQLDVLFDKMKSTPGILINRTPAILCESYTLFDHAFIGGGHGRSIHSVLEPFFGVSHIYCGPKVHRSTEYDFVKNNTPHFIHIVEKLEELNDKINLNTNKDDLSSRIAIGEKMKESFSELIKIF